MVAEDATPKHRGDGQRQAESMGTAMGTMMAHVPKEVPVAKAMKPDTTKSDAGDERGREAALGNLSDVRTRTQGPTDVSNRESEGSAKPRRELKLPRPS